MATKDELTVRLLRRFKDVPNVETDDVMEWVETAMNELGFDEKDDVPTEITSLLMLRAEADGAGQVALKTAYYFSFVDKDESIDKTTISEQYRRLSEILWKRYERKRADGVGGIGGSRFYVMKRVDR